MLTPHVERFEVDGNTIDRVPLEQLQEHDFDCGVILTDHDKFEWNSVLSALSLVIDTRGALQWKELGSGIDIFQI